MFGANFDSLSLLFYFLDKFVKDVLPNHIDVSISKTVAAGKYKLSEEEITYVNPFF